MMPRLLSALVVLLLLAVQARAADILYPYVDASHPSRDNVDIPVEQGKKGILFRMQCFDPATFANTNSCWPLASGAVSIAIGGGGPIPCSQGFNPAPGACGYTIGSFTATGPFVDTFKIIFNGNLPDNTPIAVTATAATGNAGSVLSTCPNPADSGCTLTFTTGSNTPRQNASAELVFDISGSMSQPTVQGGSVKRIDALKSAAKVFVEAYKPKAMLGDKLGVVFFASDATSAPATTPNFVAGLDTAGVTGLWTQINAQMPTSATAIGKGLQLANNGGFAADAGAPNAKWVFLFTDGEQNTQPNVTVSGNQLQIGGATYSTSSGQDPAPGQIWVCPITAGRMTAPGFALLQSIADRFCSHQNMYINSAREDFALADLQTGFMQRMATMLQGDKYEISRDLTSTVRETKEVSFLANRMDRSLQIVLTHDPRVRRVVYKLIAPDGTTVPILPRSFGGGSVAELPLPIVVDKKPVAVEGEWKIVFDPGSFSDWAGYHLVVLNDNPTISTTFLATVEDAGTGDPLTLKAAILDAGKPNENVEVKADIVGPATAIGDAISRIEGGNVDPSRQNPDQPSSAGARKLQLVFGNRRYSDLFGTKPLKSVKLGFCERNKPGCGHSSSALKPELEGHYTITFNARGASEGNGKFERTWKVAVFVRPKPDPAKTTIQVVSASGGTGSGIEASLRVTPRDRFERLIGPGYDGALAFAAGDKLYPFVADNLDGSYSFRVRTLPDDPRLVLRVMGQDVKTIDLSKAKRGGTL